MNLRCVDVKYCIRFASFDVVCSKFSNSVRHVGVLVISTLLNVLFMSSFTVIVRAGGCFFVLFSLLLYVLWFIMLCQ